MTKYPKKEEVLVIGDILVPTFTSGQEKKP